MSQLSCVSGRWVGDGVMYLLWCPGMNNNEQRTMTIIRRLVATSLTATWHLDSVSIKEMREGDEITHLMWTATMLCIFTVDVEKVRDRGGDGGRRGRVGKNWML